jgi:cytochrome c
MKKTFVMMMTVFAVLIITAISLTSVKGIGQKEIKNLAVSSIPDSLNKIFTNSCSFCHSDDGKLIAKAKLNLPNWDKYTKEEKIKKGDAICTMISEEKMPPSSVIKSKPEVKLTTNQIKDICKWTVSLSKEK